SLSLDTSPAQHCAMPPLCMISAATRSPFSASMSLTTTLAPSAEKRLAMPSPNPEPAPVTIAILFVSLNSPSSVLQHHRLQHSEAVQCLETLFAPVPRVLHPAKRQLDTTAGAVTVDEHLAAADRARQPQLPAAVARPDGGNEPERRAVRDADGVRLVRKRHRCKHGAEHLVAREAALRRHIADQARLDVVAAGRRCIDNRSFRDGRIAVAIRAGHK